MVLVIYSPLWDLTLQKFRVQNTFQNSGFYFPTIQFNSVIWIRSGSHFTYDQNLVNFEDEHQGTTTVPFDLSNLNFFSFCVNLFDIPILSNDIQDNLYPFSSNSVQWRQRVTQWSHLIIAPFCVGVFMHTRSQSNLKCANTVPITDLRLYVIAQS